jgi:hypothetical protein
MKQRGGDQFFTNRGTFIGDRLATTPDKGAYRELRAALHLYELGYSVYRNLSASGAADLVAIKWDTGEVVPIDVAGGPKAPHGSAGRVAVRIMVVPEHDQHIYLFEKQPKAIDPETWRRTWRPRARARKLTPRCAGRPAICSRLGRAGNYR